MSKNKKTNQTLLVLLPLLLAIAVVSGIFIGRFMYDIKQENETYMEDAEEDGDDNIFKELRGIIDIYPRGNKLTNIIKYISSEYVDPVDPDELIEKTLPKLVSELDPHSVYLPAEDVQTVNEPLEGNFEGIGVQFNMLNDTLIIMKTIPNGPSEKVGILAGDRILIVDGDTIAGKNISSDSIVKRLKGPRGTEVQVGIERKYVDDILYFMITRDKIPLHSMDIAYLIRPGIGYIKLNSFSMTTAEEFTRGTINLLGLGMESMILDLRGNGGGYMDPAIRIADQFLGDGQLIVYTKGNARPREDYRASKGGLCQHIKIAVLIDEGTASASEILAGALQDNDVGTIIGRRSFGKGLVQEQNMFSDGSALRLTIARYYTPTGRSIQKPYQNGDNEDYYLELVNRYTNGEVSEEDSIRFDPSLRYTTPGGKTVYGGGGIMPDIFVPIDTSGVTEYLVNVRNRGLIYRFALSYADTHRDVFERMSSTDEITAYLEQEKAYRAFIDFAAANDVPPDWKEIRESELVLKTQLYAFIARNILDNEGFYPIIEKIDNTLLKAIEVLEDK